MREATRLARGPLLAIENSGKSSTLGKAGARGYAVFGSPGFVTTGRLKLPRRFIFAVTTRISHAAAWERKGRLNGMGNSLLSARTPRRWLAKSVAAAEIALFWCLSAVGTTVGTTVGVTTLATAVNVATATPAEAGRRYRRRRRRRRWRRGRWYWGWWW
jgi:hypothetical protein